MPKTTSSAPLVEPKRQRTSGTQRSTVAMVRGVPDSFARALTRGDGPRPDVQRARAEHRAYVESLGQMVDRVVHVEADARFPDCCFIEDTVVVAGGRALVTRPGAESRQGEVHAVAAALPDWLEVLFTPEHARLDGGDVLRVGRTLLVGRSQRTDAAGIAGLRRAFEPLGFDVREVEVEGALHLKCHCSAPTSELVLLAQGFLDPAIFDDVAEVAVIPAREAYGANVVGVGKRVLFAEGHDHVERALIDRGLDPMSLSVREFAAADGSLTCLSVVITGTEG